MPICDIIIPDTFTKAVPKDWKMDKVREFVATHGKLDKPVVVNRRGVLVDNYVRYLVAKECGFATVPCMTMGEYNRLRIKSGERPIMSYVVAKFDGCPKEYIWKNDRDFDVAVGDKVLAVSKKKNGGNGVVTVTVVGLFQSNSPKFYKHKPITKVYKKN